MVEGDVGHAERRRQRRSDVEDGEPGRAAGGDHGHDRQHALHEVFAEGGQEPEPLLRGDRPLAHALAPVVVGEHLEAGQGLGWRVGGASLPLSHAGAAPHRGWRVGGEVRRFARRTARHRGTARRLSPRAGAPNAATS